MKRFLLLVFAIVFVGSCFVGCSPSYDELNWSELLLGEHLTEIDSKYWDVHNNTEKSFWITIIDVSDGQYASYVNLCKENGYTVEEERSSSYFRAYNSQGYLLDLHYMDYKKELMISLDAPRKMSEFQWPTDGVGSAIPATESNIGIVMTDTSETYEVDVANTSLETLSTYIELCKQAGFSVTYQRTDEYYQAFNEDGYEVSLQYLGFSIVRVTVKMPEKEEIETKVETDAITTGDNNVSSSLNEVTPAFKNMMDSYKKFFDDYVDFMNRYADNPLGLMDEYLKLLKDYTDMQNKLNAIETDDLSTADYAYYFDTMNHIQKKLLELGK